MLLLLLLLLNSMSNQYNYVLRSTQETSNSVVILDDRRELVTKYHILLAIWGVMEGTYRLGPKRFKRNAVRLNNCHYFNIVTLLSGSAVDTFYSSFFAFYFLIPLLS